MKKEQRKTVRSAGRPGRDTTLFAFRAPKEVADIINGQPQKTEFINNCILKAHGVERPDWAERTPWVKSITPVMGDSAENVPYLELAVACGSAVELSTHTAPQNFRLLEAVGMRDRVCCVVEVMGDSMIDEGINDGDKVIVDRDVPSPWDEDLIGVCEHNGEYTIKRFVRDKSGGGWMLPANQRFKPIRVEETDRFHIWGVVVCVIKMLR